MRAKNNNDKKALGKSFKVGDKIIDFGQVYKIFKIEKKVVHFRPYYKTKQNRTLTCSIPVKNIGLTNIRKPISKNRVKKLLERLSEKEERGEPVNAKEVGEKLKLNRPETTARILKKLWLDKQDLSKNFSGSKRNIMNLSIKQLVEEVAFVLDISIAKAKKKIDHRNSKASEIFSAKTTS